MRARHILSVLLALLVTAGLAQTGGSFASLVITPAGDEEYDIATGVTTLTQGGVIQDQGSGITLEAPHISYRVDDYIDTTSATVSGGFGTVVADSVRVDISESLLTASGNLQLTGQNLHVSGDELSFFADAAVVDLRGNVSATDPIFTASRILYDTVSGTILLFGPYSFDDGFLQLSASSPASHLELLRPDVEPADPAEFAFSVSSTPAASTLELFGPWLDR